jgi:heme/copper-type cytochrome/quinol oxidase subunit 1
MNTKQFATISIRVLGVAAIAIGGVLAGSSGIMRAVGAASLTNIPTSDLHLHDTYYVISHVEDTWLAPGTVSVITGILLLITSRRLGALLARGTEMESQG